ncbi:TIGR03809 family protein [Rhodoplanes elegans]|uniref:TIGR03809 family protein n=1 Tax=Rhodoplanes elegans TaxID=29408 RepID=A0A327KJK5_9BRAD|nr:TIGR03809 family protein [Rhodoplanes elegans]MBK5961362.1 TIGR03809 family protein [Rhodoplanes elegans]RAI38677.1 TIGR03809 family protein [Rhodoplanes elegans]
MPPTIPRAFSAATSRKGLELAERRRAHLVELYKSGRWRRYFDEQEFLARTREAVREVELWTAAVALWDEPAAAAPAELVGAAPVPEIRIVVADADADLPAERPADEIADTIDVMPAGVMSQPSGVDQSLGVSTGLA